MNNLFSDWDSNPSCMDLKSNTFVNNFCGFVLMHI